MRKIIIHIIYLFIFIFSLCACSFKDNGIKAYQKCIDILDNEINYTIEELVDGKTYAYEFADNIVHIFGEYNDVYYYSEDNKHYSLTYSKELDKYIKEEVKAIKSYELIDRFKRIYWCNVYY